MRVETYSVTYYSYSDAKSLWEGGSRLLAGDVLDYVWVPSKGSERDTFGTIAINDIFDKVVKTAVWHNLETNLSTHPEELEYFLQSDLYISEE